MMNEPVSTIMTRELITVGPDNTISDVHKILSTNRIHHVPVVEGDQLVGLLTTYDLFRISGRKIDFDQIKVNEVMTTHLATLEPNAKIGSAAEIFLEHLFHALPIVDEGDRLVGIVTTMDVLKYNFAKAYPLERYRLPH